MMTHSEERRVLSREEVRRLVSERHVIGEGAFGKVFLVKWGEDGQDAVLKIAKKYTDRRTFDLEAYFLERLKGAGGAPRLLAVSRDPQSLVTTFAGHHTFLDALRGHCLPDWYLGLLGRQICLQVQELHSLGVLHNDLHSGNVMVTVPDDLSRLPQVAIIDFGCAIFDAATAAGIPSDDEYHNLVKCHSGKGPPNKKRDLFFLSRFLLASVFPSIKKEPTESLRFLVSDYRCGPQHLADKLAQAFPRPEGFQPQAEEPQPQQQQTNPKPKFCWENL